MNIETLEVGPIGTSCYVVWGKTAEALVIDPGADAEAILNTIRSKKLSIAAYLLTHGHMDHVSALADMYDKAPAPIAIHSDDLAWAFGDMNTMWPIYPTAPRSPAKVERILKGGEEFTDAGLRYRVINTPGHTPGGVCFHFFEEGVLFSGDTLFAGSVGRTDLPGGDSRVLARSLATLTKLPDTTTIYPGHGPTALLGDEKRTNYFLKR